MCGIISFKTQNKFWMESIVYLQNGHQSIDAFSSFTWKMTQCRYQSNLCQRSNYLLRKFLLREIRLQTSEKISYFRKSAKQQI